jgi:hypothetical protein
MLAAGVLWSIAITLMVAVTAGSWPLIVAGWALMLALWACVFTGWALVLRERVRVETLAEILLRDDRTEVLKRV